MKKRSEVRGQRSEGVSRREALGRLALASAAAAISFTPSDVAHAAKAALDEQQQAAQYRPRFFTAHEYATVGILADEIIPRDERSGSASDAGVPRFRDFIRRDGSEARRIAMRGGLAWMDRESRTRFGRDFRRLTSAQRRQILDDIAYPRRAKPEHSHGVAFFNSFRDLTASGFWSSRMGVTDLGYQGNVFVAEWKGCPPDVLRRLGVS
jgi:gluconate 2-dehydrogenase gamma chain